ncbi:hypothetical protein BCON_0004g00160 [Botryotinia convoluta]|uniref:Uncharacterized protein n=1 Tax=Botryotinia convoluta TaxID=54673 RepID=A0A4Z1IU75_9HELO|nr:hypothetical protein BCON_0004g00160 [Botryotinia convoluta]
MACRWRFKSKPSLLGSVEAESPEVEGRDLSGVTVVDVIGPDAPSRTPLVLEHGGRNDLKVSQVSLRIVDGKNGVGMSNTLASLVATLVYADEHWGGIARVSEWISVLGTIEEEIALCLSARLGDVEVPSLSHLNEDTLISNLSFLIKSFISSEDEDGTSSKFG